MPTIIRDKLAAFFNGYLFPIYVAICVIIGHIYDHISIGITLIILAAALGFLVCKDFKFFIPVLLSTYFIISKKSIQEETLYSKRALLLYFILLVILFISFVAHIIIYRKNFKMKRFTSSRLSLGFVLISIVFILNGALALETYNKFNIFFGTVIAISFFIPFFLLTINTDFNKDTLDYLAYVLVVISLTLLFEMAYAYRTYVVIENGIIQRSTINFGWGVTNNIGAMLGMLIPAHFYLAFNKRFSFIYIGTGMLCYSGVLLSMSRAAILCSTFTFFMCLIAVYVFRNKNKLINETTVAVCLFVVLCVVYKYHDILLRLFDGIIQRGFDDSGRFIYYKDGLKKFLQHPLLGMGFGNSHGVNDKFIIPAPEYFHNTIVQVLASCGIVGMVAYMVHRVETIVLFFKNRSYASFFMGMSILNLLLTSLLDIHMFNIFPAMFYSVILCFFEQHTKTETLN
jgi:hypothetical protein